MGKLNECSEVLKKAFTFEELNAMQARITPVIDAEQGKSAPPGNIIDLKPVLEAARSTIRRRRKAAELEGPSKAMSFLTFQRVLLAIPAPGSLLDRFRNIKITAF